MRGRRVPVSRERLDAALQAAQETVEYTKPWALAQPTLVRLGDARKLRKVDTTLNGATYRGDDGMIVMWSADNTPHGILKHLSVSYRTHLPSWEDLTLLRAAFFDADRDVIQVLPRRGEYINWHAYCLHLFEAPETWQGGLFV